MATCSNCQFEFQERAPICPQCGARTRKTSHALEIVSALSLVLVGLPAALFGTCMVMLERGQNPETPVSALGLAGFAVFGVTIWFARKVHKR